MRDQRVTWADARPVVACAWRSARATDVLVLVLKQGMGLAIGGAAPGVLIALILGRVLSALLFGGSGRDPLTLAVVNVVLTPALLACYIHARRAARIDLLAALRSE